MNIIHNKYNLDSDPAPTGQGPSIDPPTRKRRSHIPGHPAPPVPPAPAAPAGCPDGSVTPTPENLRFKLDEAVTNKKKCKCHKVRVRN